MYSSLKNLLGQQFFEIVPFNIAIIDRDHSIITANKNFEDYFGDWRGKKCYEVYKKRGEKCTHCRIEDIFEKGITRVSNEAGFDKHGKLCHYVVHLAPLKDDSGQIPYIVEMSMDLTETTRWQQEYNLLFEKVPSYVSIIDRNYKIVRANRKLRDTFGDVHGKYCFEVYKKRKRKCKNCPAAQTFKDGRDHLSAETGLTYSGEETKYMVTTTALSMDEEGVQSVIEIATDITELSDLQLQLRRSHDFYANLIEHADYGVIALDPRYHTIIFNAEARKILNWQSFKKPVINQLKSIMPVEFFNSAADNGIICDNIDTYLRKNENELIPIRFSAVQLTSRNEVLGRACFIQDLRRIRKLEKEKLDAERLGAVGETVAGLAHTIKNVLMGLEGGMYITDRGLRQGDPERIMQGWDILKRNFNKTTDLVKGFLNFAKGKLPELVPTNVNELVKNIVNLYFDSARSQNVFLTAELAPNLILVLLDPEGMEASITNLVSNAIDAAMMREDRNGQVVIRTRLIDEVLNIEVEDNGCGMDSEVIQNIFTTFFTTKGNKGTGLGLLTTNKIIKEHGGYLDVKSDIGIGSIFSIVLPLENINAIANQ